MRSAEALHTLVRSSGYFAPALALGSPDSDGDNTQTEKANDKQVVLVPAKARQKQLGVTYWEDNFKTIEHARQEAGLFLHHDLITGGSASAYRFASN